MLTLAFCGGGAVSLDWAFIAAFLLFVSRSGCIACMVLVAGLSLADRLRRLASGGFCIGLGGDTGVSAVSVDYMYRG